MTPQEMLSEVYRYIDQSFAEGKDLKEVLREIPGYIEALEVQ